MTDLLAMSFVIASCARVEKELPKDGGLPHGAGYPKEAGGALRDRSLGAEDAAIDSSRSDGPGGGDSADASSDTPIPIESSSFVDAGRPTGPPPEILSFARDWPMANRDYAATRATTDATIDKSNVATLAEVWSAPLPAGPSAGSATSVPIVLGGTVYYQDMTSNVFAMDAITGTVKWQKEYSMPSVGPNGLAIGWGKLFTASSDRTFAALDVETGQEIWTAPIRIPDRGGIDIAPVAYGGLVYVSTVPASVAGGYAGGVAGVLYALDERSGEVVWAFDTDESGNLWGDPVVNSGGGAWYPPTIDVTRGLMYWGTGNPGPWPLLVGSPSGSTRPGPNLYTDSVVALSLEDGRLRWFHQERAHDLFDLDFQNPPIIVDATIDGGSRRVVLGSGKTGTVVALDAETGRVFWRAPVGKHLNDDATSIPDGGLWVYPGFVGGVIAPPAYADGILYVPYNDYGIQYSGGFVGGVSAAAAGVVALDVATGNTRWDARYGDADGGPGVLALGGATVANDLVFTSTSDGTVYAHDRENGQEVWRYTAPTGINAPLAIAGDTLYVPAGRRGAPALIALRLR